jgi:uncharacterized paraquat-inducible protein A
MITGGWRPSYLLVVRRSVRNNQAQARIASGIIGRSMVDVFVATFVIALIQLRPLMSVAPSPGSCSSRRWSS